MTGRVAMKANACTVNCNRCETVNEALIGIVLSKSAIPLARKTFATEGSRGSVLSETENEASVLGRSPASKEP